MRSIAAVALFLSLAACASSQPKKKEQDDAKPDYSRGRKMIDAYFKHQVKQIEKANLAEIKTLEDWKKKRPELRRQFLDMMGLWPLPERTDLKATITGTVDGGNFTIEKLHFQSMPGLYVTANLYLPKRTKDGPLPAIVYVCGHGNTVVDGVSYGSKVSYQYHPTWFAENGYVCIILDTLQLAEIQGLHHGQYREKMWWWQAKGYTPGGVELWNAMRAIDYLETRPEVDAKRIGITGRSGGGATSWWVAAADDRVQAAVPVAGITDLYSHLCEAPAERLKDGVIAGHCDCMYMVNTYRWDFGTVAALFAPRPLLLGNSDDDAIFPVKGYRHVYEQASKIYKLYGAEDKFQLLETKGPHRDTPELHLGINRWMNRWLKGDVKSEVKPDLTKRFQPQQLKVFDKLPEPRRNETIHESFTPTAKFDIPADPKEAKAWWAKKKPELMEALKTRVFSGWPKNPPPLDAKVAADVTHDGVRLRAIDFTSEEEIRLRMFVLTSPKVKKLKEVNLGVLDDSQWDRLCRELGPDFGEALQVTVTRRDETAYWSIRDLMERQEIALVRVVPRGTGQTKWADPGSRDDIQIRRRFQLIGQSLDGQRVWDTRRAIAALKILGDSNNVPLTVGGMGEPAVLALYAGLFEPSVTRIVLLGLPGSHRDGPALLNALKYVDVPQALAMTEPRKVELWIEKGKPHELADFALKLQQKLGTDGLTVMEHLPLR